MNVIKVLHVTNVEKVNYYLANLVEYSDASAVEFSFVTFGPDDCEFVTDFRRREINAMGIDAVGRSTYPRTYRKLRSIFAEQKPDIVHTHLFDPSLMGLTAARRAGIKTVLTRHHSDGVHAIPSSMKRRFYLGLESYISRSAAHIIAPSRMVREFLVRREGVPDHKVSIIPYGQTTERFDAVTPDKVSKIREEFQMDRCTALVCVSRLNHRKGHKFLFEALAELAAKGRDAYLYLVGEGDEREELQRLASELRIADRVTFLGWRDDALVIMAAADAIVHPSLEDALSSAVIEAVMLGRPIVATDISGVHDTLDDGKYGVIVEPESADALAVGIAEMLENLEAAKTRAATGREYLLDYMDSKRTADATLDIYRSVLAQS